MRFIICLFLSLLLVYSTKAQQNHFIYIQTENRQPFFVKSEGKLLSSSAAGYLVIPKLTDAVYDLIIGFPKNEWPSQHIILAVKGRDEGFLLKNFSDKGWGLFNLQSLNVVMAEQLISGQQASANGSTGFSNSLSAVTNSPLEKVQDSLPLQKAKPALPIDSVVATDGSKPVQIEIASGNNIHKSFDVVDASGRSAIYVVKNELNVDTVRIYIPYPAETTPNQVIHQITAIDTVSNVTKPSKNDSVPQVSVNVTDTAAVAAHIQKDTLASPIPDQPKKNEEKQETKTGDCKAVAVNDDFLKLRKNMAAAENEDDMVDIARKEFKSKCYSSEQVKNLGLLFLKEENRYHFFDTAYKYVSDPGNFPTLQAQLSDPYFINRFKAMLH